MKHCQITGDEVTEPKTLRERTELAARSYAGLEEYPNTVWQRKGFVNGALHGPPIEFAIERMKKAVESIYYNEPKTGGKLLIEAIEQLKEARR